MTGRLRLHDRLICDAVVASTGGTCARRKVGCVLVDARGKTLSTGYNGPPSGFTHCLDVPCPGVGMASGTGLGDCRAVHAEQNALLQCPDVMRVATCYTTTSPCVHCTKLLLNTGCQEVVYLEEYPGWEACRDLWLTVPAGQRETHRSWRKYQPSDDTARFFTASLAAAVDVLMR